MEKYVLLVGSIVDGVSVHGPFDDLEEAISYVEDSPLKDYPWEVATLEGPDR